MLAPVKRMKGWSILKINMDNIATVYSCVLRTLGPSTRLFKSSHEVHASCVPGSALLLSSLDLCVHAHP